MKAKTAVLSARIPTDAIKEIDRICKKNGINRSQWVVHTLAKDKSNEVVRMHAGGKLQFQSAAMPIELQNMLAGLGLVMAGTTLYALTREVLIRAVDKDGKPQFTDGQIELVSAASLVALAIAGVGAFNAIINEK